MAFSEVPLRTAALGATPALTAAAAGFSVPAASIRFAPGSPGLLGVEFPPMLVVYLESGPIKLRVAKNAACR